MGIKKTIVDSINSIVKVKLDSSVLLLLMGLSAIIIANSPLSEMYKTFLSHPVNIEVGRYSLFSHHGEPMTVAEFVNDALMAVFFFVVGLEIKQEILVGELSSTKKALLPIIAAIGGMIIPVLLFYLFCHSGPESRGAAIPMATDIAFALAVLGILGSRIPYSLKIFLTALAVVDDIGGIIIIALFYSSHVALIYLIIASVLLLIIYVSGRRGVHSSFFYYIMGFVVWTLFLMSGIHPTIAGVLVALCAPARTKIHLGNLQNKLHSLFNMLPKSDHRESGGAVVLSHEQINIVNSIRETTRNSISPVQMMESELAPIVHYFILPLFAFVNVGIDLSDIDINSILGLPLAVTLGLFPGKAIGIFAFTYLAIKTKVCSRPKGMTYKNLLGLSILGGIGFTVSLFIANLSYNSHEMITLLNQAKLGIFIGTILSALFGLYILRVALKK